MRNFFLLAKIPLVLNFSFVDSKYYILKNKNTKLTSFKRLLDNEFRTLETFFFFVNIKHTLYHYLVRNTTILEMLELRSHILIFDYK